MLTPRNLAIVAAAAGAFAGLPLSTAQACDNDRFPCPIVADSPTPETAEAPSRASPAAQPRKKASQSARQGDKPTAKVERDASQAPARPKASKPPVHEQAEAPPKAGKPPAPEQVDNSSAQKAAEAAPAALPPADQSRIGSAEPSESAPAPAAALAPASADGTGVVPSASDAAATTQSAAADGVHVVDPNEVNELDLAAADPAPPPAESSWLSYLLMTLGGALAAASTVRLFLF
ncbi:MAG TPA: hypothetical protein VH397_04400 [Xanthobacteraceae bacterium]|jgi:hypothetical protein